jgi:hypothetical protein
MVFGPVIADEDHPCHLLAVLFSYATFDEPEDTRRRPDMGSGLSSEQGEAAATTVAAAAASLAE